MKNEKLLTTEEKVRKIVRQVLKEEINSKEFLHSITKLTNELESNRKQFQIIWKEFLDKNKSEFAQIANDDMLKQIRDIYLNYSELEKSITHLHNLL